MPSSVVLMEASDAPLENLVLIGFMGCGKSTVGRALQQRLGYPLVDMDQVIEQRAGKPIARIFSEDGEGVFRDMESALLREFGEAGGPRRIISTGGGVVVREENRAQLGRLGYVVWLNAPAEVVWERTSKNRSRPLLQVESPMERIRTLMAEREPLYQQAAHLKLDTAGLCSDEIAAGILECARYFFTRGS